MEVIFLHKVQQENGPKFAPAKTLKDRKTLVIKWIQSGKDTAKIPKDPLSTQFNKKDSEKFNVQRPGPTEDQMDIEVLWLQLFYNAQNRHCHKYWGHESFKRTWGVWLTKTLV